MYTVGFLFFYSVLRGIFVKIRMLGLSRFLLLLKVISFLKVPPADDEVMSATVAKHDLTKLYTV